MMLARDLRPGWWISMAAPNSRNDDMALIHHVERCGNQVLLTLDSYWGPDNPAGVRLALPATAVVGGVGPDEIWPGAPRHIKKRRPDGYTFRHGTNVPWWN